jgi:hypothetical protein
VYTTNDVPYNHVAWFNEPSAFIRQGVDFTAIGPDALPGLALNRTHLSYLESLINETSAQEQENLAASLDLTVPVAVGRFVSGYVKFGGKHYDTFRERRFTGLSGV